MTGLASIPPASVTEAFNTLRDEITVLRRNLTRSQRQEQQTRERLVRVERRLTGALYELYGDWDRVNRELPR